MPGGSCRDMFLYVREGLVQQAHAFLAERLEGVAAVRQVRQLADDGFFGPEPLAPEFWARAGDLGIKQVITSPLTRAIQTALAIFDGVAPIRVGADHREQLQHSCDVGRPPEALQRDFPDLSFAHLQNVWWHQGPENDNGVAEEPDDVFRRRIDAFARSLDRITDRPVAIVGHNNVFRAMIGRAMENCEIHLYQPGESPID